MNICKMCLCDVVAFHRETERDPYEVHFCHTPGQSVFPQKVSKLYLLTPLIISLYLRKAPAVSWWTLKIYKCYYGRSVSHTS